MFIYLFIFLFNLSSKYASADNLVSSLFMFSLAYHWHNPCHLMPHDLSVSPTTHPVCAVSFSCCPEQNEDEVQNAYTRPGKYRALVTVTVCDDSLSILLFRLSLGSMNTTRRIPPTIQKLHYFIWKWGKSFKSIFNSIRADHFDISMFKNSETGEIDFAPITPRNQFLQFRL